MKRLYFRRKNYWYILCAVIVLLLLFLLFSSTENAVQDCLVSKEVVKKMSNIAGKLKEIISLLNLRHFLCYNTLWGALKVKGPLPWETKLEVCLFNEDLSKMDEAYFIRVFKRYGLELSYETGSGIYHVSLLGDKSCEALLFVFEQDSITSQFRRVGWKHRVLPPESCDILHCFPHYLVLESLPTVTFLSQTFNVPRDGIEIQKYHYPNSWWKDLEPERCKVAVS